MCARLLPSNHSTAWRTLPVSSSSSPHAPTKSTCMCPAPRGSTPTTGSSGTCQATAAPSHTSSRSWDGHSGGCVCVHATLRHHIYAVFDVVRCSGLPFLTLPAVCCACSMFDRRPAVRSRSLPSSCLWRTASHLLPKPLTASRCRCQDMRALAAVCPGTPDICRTLHTGEWR